MNSQFVSREDQRRIEKFVKTFSTHCTGVAVIVPSEMRDGNPNSDGWIPWKPVPSPVTEDNIINVEKKVGFQLPPLFRAYLTYKCLLMTDFFVQLPETPFDDPLGPLMSFLNIYLNQPFYKQNNIAPFATDSNDAGMVCFNLAKPTADNDYPILLVDVSQIVNSEFHEVEIAGSFAELLDMIEDDLKSYD